MVSRKCGWLLEGKRGRLEALSLRSECGPAPLSGLGALKLSVLASWGRRDYSGRDRCLGLETVSLVVPRTTCFSDGQLGTPPNLPRSSQEEESG